MDRILIDGLLINEKNTGIGNYSLNYINALNNNTDFDITLLSGKNETYQNINLIHKNFDRSYLRIIEEQLSLPFYSQNYDLIHFLDYSSPLVDLKKPFLITIHDLSFYKYPETFTFASRTMKRILAPISIKRAEKVIVDSKNTRNDLLELFDINSSKVEVVYPGKTEYNNISFDFINTVTNKYNIDSDYILYLGTLEPRKNIVRLIEAYNILRKKGIKEKLVIAGKKGWLYEDIFERVEEYSLSDCVIFTGFVAENEKPALYKGAKVFVYPSLYEGFGLPPLEAMSCSTAVVVADSSSLSEVVGDCGVYVKPEDEVSIAEGLYDIIKNDNLRMDFEDKGLMRSKEFSWEKSAERIQDIYREVLG